MKKNDLMKFNESIIRVLEIEENKILIIDCLKRIMPKWVDSSTLSDFSICSKNDLLSASEIVLEDFEKLDAESKRFAHEHFTLIAGILPFVDDERQRNYIISEISKDNHVSKQTIRNYLCLYLIFQDISALTPKQKRGSAELSEDEKNMRWAINKFFYTKDKNSLNTAYTLMIKEKYCDPSGKLLPEYPSFNQFRYFYRKYRKMQTYYISREGIKSYQRNNRPLLGDGIQEYASYVGVAMFDATVCDIYLVNESGQLIGRPILTAAVDGYSSLCIGYFLSWEGGVYSLRNLVSNILADKQIHCKKHGIMISSDEWECNKLPSVFVTDMGTEYTSGNFEQISELGVTVVNLPSYRPELKGNIEKFFDLVQDSYKPYLKRKGVLEPDFQERGVRDYRKDACLTMADFEKIVLHCILYYNNQRIIENYPYSEEMLMGQIKPYARDIYKWGCTQMNANLIDADYQTVMLVLLPRTTGTFSRKGLIVNKMRYHAEGFTENYLRGDSAIVAYNPDDVSKVWLIQDGNFTEFNLIESRYIGKDLASVQSLQEMQKEMIANVKADNLQAKIDLANHIQAITNAINGNNTVNVKAIRENRKHEKNRNHIDLMKEALKHD